MYNHVFIVKIEHLQTRSSRISTCYQSFRPQTVTSPVTSPSDLKLRPITIDYTRIKKRFEHTKLPAKLLDYFLRSNKSNINQLTSYQSPHQWGNSQSLTLTATASGRERSANVNVLSDGAGAINVLTPTPADHDAFSASNNGDRNLGDSGSGFLSHCLTLHRFL